MSKEFSLSFNLRNGLVPSDDVPRGTEGLIKAENLLCKEGALKPFDYSIHETQEARILSTKQHIYVLYEGVCEIYDAETLALKDSFVLAPGPFTWTLFDFGEYEIVVRGAENIVYTGTAFHQDDPLFPTTILTGVNFNDQLWVADEHKIYASRIGQVNFTLDEVNEAGEIPVEARIKALARLRSRIYVFTTKGMWFVEPGSQSVRFQFYKGHVIENAQSLCVDGRSILYMTSDKHLHRLWFNGESQHLDYSWLFQDIDTTNIWFFYCPDLRAFFITTSARTLAYTQHGMTELTHRLFGHITIDNILQFYGQSGARDWSLQTFWFDFGSTSRTFVRAIEVFGNLLQPHAINGHFALRYFRTRKNIYSKAVRMSSQQTFHPMLSANEFSFVATGPTASLGSLTHFLIRFQSDDKSIRRGL